MSNPAALSIDATEGQRVHLVTEADGYVNHTPLIGVYEGRTPCGFYLIRKADGNIACIDWHVVRGFRAVQDAGLLGPGSETLDEWRRRHA